MFRVAIPLAAVTLAIFGAVPANAQLRSRLLDESQYRRLGLEVVWTSQIQLDSLRSEVAELHLQVVGRESYENLQQTSYDIYEVTYGENQVRRFGENDADRLGQILGKDEAKRLAEKLVIQLEARGLKPKLEVRRVPATVLYAQSSGGTLHAMDAETGKTLWAITIGHPRHPNLRPGANDRFVAAVSGSRLFLLDRVTGEPIWDRELRQTPVMGPTVSNNMVFVPGLNGQVEGYRLPTAETNHAITPAWMYQSGARITARPAITDSTVSWATTDGVMFVASLDGPRMMYRRQTSGPIFGQAAFLPPDQLVIASTDGYVTALNEMDGTLKWTFSTGYATFQTPLALPDHVYAVSRLGRMFSISSTDGAEQWMTPGISELIASSNDRVYVRDSLGRLTAIDKKDGTKLASIPTGGYRMSLANNVTDRIYLLSDSGMVQCLREIGSPYPIVHRPLPTEPTEERSDKRRPPAAEQQTAPPQQQPAADDLFGDDFGADMFDAEEADAPADDQPADEEPDAGDMFDPAPAADDEPDDEPADDEPIEDDPFDFG
jgi:outer membrane protein assembly factor BamB